MPDLPSINDCNAVSTAIAAAALAVSAAAVAASAFAVAYIVKVINEWRSWKK